MSIQADEAAILSEPKIQARTGLTGRTVLLPGDDAARYEAHVAQFFEGFQPVGDDERNLVQSLADTEWRLQRIPSLEMGIYALGRLEFAELFPNEDDSVRQHLIEAKIFLTYQRQLNNLSVQEGRQDDFDDPSKLGFEFSLAEIEVRAIDLDPTLFVDWDPDADEEAA